ncbi:hypothetical protein ACOMHN_027978 [Nucella lapillus]
MCLYVCELCLYVDALPRPPAGLENTPVTWLDVQVARNLDREGTARYSLQVAVSDNGSPKRTATTTVTITVNDANDHAPVWVSPQSFSFPVAEDAKFGTTVGKVSATDADIGLNAALTYSVVLFWTGNVSHFTLEGATGVLKTAAMLDRESIASYTALLRVADGGNPQLHADVNVSFVITDVNDNRPAFSQPNHTNSTTENRPVGTTVIALTVTDADTGVNDDVTLSIDTSTDAGKHADTFFQVSSATGAVTVKKVIDREVDSSFHFVIVATDAGSPSLTSSAPVVINVDDVNDNAPVFTKTYYNTEVAYLGHCSKSIVTLTATDADTGVRGQVSYFSRPRTLTVCLEWTVGQVIVCYVSLLDHYGGGEFHTQAGSYSLNALHLPRVEARDGGSLSLTSPAPALVRVDAMVPGEVVVVFELGVSQGTFRVQQDAFLQRLQGVVRDRYPSAVARLWCATGQGSSQTKALVYFLKDDSTEFVANSQAVKRYLGQSEARSVFTSDLNGTPGPVLAGPEFSPFRIQAVHPYTAMATAWHQTTEGIALIVMASVLAAVFLAAATYMICTRRGCMLKGHAYKAHKPRPPVDKTARMR